LIVAVLGSSALGAVVGGTLTTWLRGRIEREEAWRTRLLDAASSLGTDLSQLLLRSALIRTRLDGGDRWNPEEEASTPLMHAYKEQGDAWDRVRISLTPVQILFGSSSDTFRSANLVLLLLADMRRALRGETDRLHVALTYTDATDSTEVAIDCYQAAVREFDRFTGSATAHIQGGQPKAPS
jgi:hypothetical protein